MTDEQELALYRAGFSKEEIDIIKSAKNKPAEPAPVEPEKVEEKAPADPAPVEPEKKTETVNDSVPKWFNDFVAQYNTDRAAIERALQITNIRHAGIGENEPKVKSPYELMAEAYNNIK